MLLSVTALLGAAVGLAAAAGPAQATYCSEDNLLRALQHTPTPASIYCSTPTGYPTFLAVSTYLPSRLASGCSCFSRFPTEGVAAPACSPTVYAVTGTTDQNRFAVNLVVTINRNVPCGAGYKVTSLCGDFGGFAASLGATYDSPDNCFLPSLAVPLTSNGVGIVEPNGLYTARLFRGEGTETSVDLQTDGADTFVGTYTAVACGTTPQCPAPITED